MNFITKDPQIMYFTVAVVTCGFILKGLVEFGRPFELSVFLFLGTYHYYASFNGIRQYMVAAVLFWAVRYVISGSWKRYMSIVPLCSLFHSSALIMIPVYFLVRKSLVARDFRTVGIVSSYDVSVSEVHFAVCRRAGKQLIRPL